MTTALLWLCGGLAGLLAGGDFLVRGASGLASRLGVSPLVIGLTVVAFGTSAPELSINLMATYRGDTSISFGNIIGSNIANIGLILGVSALIRPLVIQGVVIAREIPMMILAALAALAAGSDPMLRQGPGAFDRFDGVLFLLLFGVFLFYTLGDVLRQREHDPVITQAQTVPAAGAGRGVLGSLVRIAAGLTLLVAGGDIAVDAAVVIAGLFKVSEVIIGLTVIAIGTSLPELVTSIMATFKGQTDLAVGNVVGSNIFNLLFINGLCASLSPIAVPAPGGWQDLFVMVVMSLFLLPMCITHRRQLVRWEGALLLAVYLGYSLWRVA